MIAHLPYGPHATGTVSLPSVRSAESALKKRSKGRRIAQMVERAAHVLGLGPNVEGQGLNPTGNNLPHVIPSVFPYLTQLRQHRHFLVAQEKSFLIKQLSNPMST